MLHSLALEVGHIMYDLSRRLPLHWTRQNRSFSLEKVQSMSDCQAPCQVRQELPSTLRACSERQRSFLYLQGTKEQRWIPARGCLNFVSYCVPQKCWIIWIGFWGRRVLGQVSTYDMVTVIVVHVWMGWRRISSTNTATAGSVASGWRQGYSKLVRRKLKGRKATKGQFWSCIFWCLKNSLTLPVFYPCFSMLCFLIHLDFPDVAHNARWFWRRVRMIFPGPTMPSPRRKAWPFARCALAAERVGCLAGLQSRNKALVKGYKPWVNHGWIEKKSKLKQGRME